MGKKLAISLFIVAVGAFSNVVRAADQSLHFPDPAPAAAGDGASAQKDDLRTAIKANGLPPIGSGSIDLIGLPVADLPAAVTNKAAVGQCQSMAPRCPQFQVNDTGFGAVPCSGAASCCDRFFTVTGFAVFAVCGNGSGLGFQLSRGPSIAGVGPDHMEADPIGGGNVTHMGVENKNIYTSADNDPAEGTLIQVRPNGVTGTIQIQILHTQGGANPRTASVTVNSTNNDPGEAQALHNAIETALENIAPALPIPIVATTHTLQDATAPLTAFGWLKQASHFVEITNMSVAGIQDVRFTVPVGQGVTVEGTDRVIDNVVPTLNEWGIIALVLVLMLCGYVLIKRQKARAAAAV